MCQIKTLLYYEEMESVIGPLTIIATENGICRLDFGSMEDNLPTLRSWMAKHFIKGELIHSPERLDDAVQQLHAYFAGNLHEFSVNYDLFGTAFQKKVWNQLTSIPYGGTCSYKEVAQGIGAPKAVRAVGSANNQNPVPIFIPCHRVIGSNGALVGYGGGLDKKEILLSIEQNSCKKTS
ncbi:methylated-DNA--[protein]-cysteine S-methyltransferase [Fictibacillus norfolkensis]|jgi:methylated-DNA-[protein]-cysteine S-methyltransferase|uniref:Methylated-DNA--protein-cysteine methyltransferase n=1 Tax=Fictibacillus norfolkensis TaxID=2762233 RepID=A0ABR8SPH3_9BACL|nr:methylated-DNA--[protein]-cysteine S-methyltransferase [Fictibacillus norfolkensis]MBD7965401.1 methylated-DNA--[protein]-cysteine S-methyltransferase [Fictibacillus norfolkensis]